MTASTALAALTTDIQDFSNTAVAQIEALKAGQTTGDTGATETEVAAAQTAFDSFKASLNAALAPTPAPNTTAGGPL